MHDEHLHQTCPATSDFVPSRAGCQLELGLLYRRSVDQVRPSAAAAAVAEAGADFVIVGVAAGSLDAASSAAGPAASGLAVACFYACGTALLAIS